MFCFRMGLSLKCPYEVQKQNFYSERKKIICSSTQYSGLSDKAPSLPSQRWPWDQAHGVRRRQDAAGAESLLHGQDFMCSSC